MNDLNKKAFKGLFQFIISLGLLLFLPAWDIHYWQGWVFLAVFSLSVLAITLYLMKYDTKLLERRVNAGPAAEQQKSQKRIQLLASIALLAVIVLPAIDHRFSWSVMPWSIIVLGDFLVATGLYVVFLVFRENSFTSAIIEVGAEQKVISTGPYSLVRHPMYSGALIMLGSVPLALGSWWGLLPVISMIAIIIVRLLDEEKFLENALPDYMEYLQKVKFRLVPGIW